MILSDHPIYAFIQNAGVLKEVDGRWHGFDNPFVSIPSKEGYTLSEFAAFDPRLAVVMPEMQKLTELQMDNLKTDNYPTIFGTFLRQTLAYWNTPNTLIDAQGKTHVYHSFEGFVDFLEPKDDNTVILQVLEYELVNVQGTNGEAVEFARGTPLFPVWVAKPWLEEHFPGWEDRRRVAEALGYEGYALMQAIFHPQESPTHAVSLEGVSFD